MDHHTKPATAPGKSTFGPVQLDAYPRLCGLPVTVERVSLTSVAAAVDPLPAERASRPRSPVAYLVVAVLAVVAAVLVGASVARAQAPARTVACGQTVALDQAVTPSARPCTYR
jgi:hypothetical protein